MTFKRIAILPMLALPLCAGGNERFGLEANASAVLASQDMNKLTSGSNLTGTTLGLAFRAPITPGLNYRLHFDLLGFKAARGTGLEGAANKHMILGWDLTQDVGKWTVFGGLMGVKWRQDIQRDTLSAYQGLRGEPKGTKFGARFGAEYTVTKDWRATFAYNQTEFNRDINPGWWGLGVTYRFMGW